MGKVFIEAKTKAEAVKKAPAGYTEKVVKAEGGYNCYSSLTDYHTDKRQK